MIRNSSYLKARRGGFAAGLVLAVMAAGPLPMWGQWNGTNPVWTNSNVGIGTATPMVPLHLGAGGGFTALAVGDPYSTANGTAGIGLQRWTDGFVYSDFKTVPGGKAVFRIGAGTEAAYARSWMAVDSASGYVGIGTINPQYKLAVNGNIGAQDIIVTNTGWSDYVFRPGYRLRPLSEVSPVPVIVHWAPPHA